MVVSSNCIVLHPQTPYKLFKYTTIVRLLLNSYETITLLVNSEHKSWVEGLYHDLVMANKLVICSLDNDRDGVQLLCHEKSDIKGYEEYDSIRYDIDPCKNRIQTVSQFSMDLILSIYSEDFHKNRKAYSEIQLVLTRDIQSETKMMDKLKKIVQFKFAIISDDKQKSICHENESNCINIKKLFPKNNRITFWIPLLQKASFIVVTDDEVAAFVHILQNEKIKDEYILGKNKSVYFVLPSKKNKQDFKLFENWKFVKI